jgi:hypothetical protein
VRLVVPESCDENQRFVWWSMKPIGSSDTVEEVGKLTSFHVAVAGETLSSNVARSASRPAWYIARPSLQLTPIDGSPASFPMAAGGWTLEYVRCSLPPAGIAGSEPRRRIVALAV